MREATITFSDVDRIAQQLQREGIRPSPRKIREIHGSGSLGTIHPLLEKWKAAQSNPDLIAASIPLPVQQAILEHIISETTKARSELAQQLQELQNSASEVAQDNERQAQKIANLELANNSLQIEKSELTGRVTQLEGDLEVAKKEAAQERLAAESARTDFAKAQLRLESTPLLEQRIAQLQEELKIERMARTDAERMTAASKARADGLAERLNDNREHANKTAENLERCEAERQHLAAELASMEKELRLMTSQLGQAQGTIAALQTRPIEEETSTALA